MNQTTEEIIENWIKQLRKGTLELAILSFINKHSENTYGYDLIKNLNEAEIEIEGNTVYPILRRLEKAELIESTWITKDNQPKKFFKITQAGHIILKRMKKEWSFFNTQIKHFINEEV